MASLGPNGLIEVLGFHTFLSWKHLPYIYFSLWNNFPAVSMALPIISIPLIFCWRRVDIHLKSGRVLSSKSLLMKIYICNLTAPYSESAIKTNLKFELFWFWKVFFCNSWLSNITFSLDCPTFEILLNYKLSCRDLNSDPPSGGIPNWIQYIYTCIYIYIAKSFENWGGVLFRTQAWVLLKWKFTQGHI